MLSISDIPAARLKHAPTSCGQPRRGRDLHVVVVCVKYIIPVIFLNTRQSWLLKPTPNNPRRVKPLPLQYIPNRQHLNPAALDPINLQIPGLRHIPVKTPKGN